jgi:hypothetical protein
MNFIGPSNFLAFCAFIVCIFPMIKACYKRETDWFKNNAVTGIIGFIVLFVTIYQNCSTEVARINDEKRKDSIAAKDRSDDSIFQINVFKEFHIGRDSANKPFDIRIKTTNKEPPPLIYLSNEGNTYIRMNEQKDTIRYRFIFRNDGNVDAYNLKIKVYFLSIDHANHIISDGPDDNSSVSYATAPHGKTSFLIGFNTIDRRVNSDSAYFYLKGSYTNYTKSIIQQIDCVIPWWPGMSTIGPISDDTKKYVIRLMGLRLK